LTIPQPKEDNILSKVLTLKAHARKSGVTKGPIFWRFLSWGIDYSTKNPKTKFGRITFWIYNHPSAHCEVDSTNGNAKLASTFLKIVFFFCCLLVEPIYLNE
jgi:hypothetical protein